MIVLAVDTASSLCAACVHDGEAGGELGRAVLDIGKGHAEHLLPVIGDALETAGVAFPALERIVVSIGPGSFTGVRVGVATARGLALALRIPAIGVSTLEAIAAETQERFAGRDCMVALDAGRGGLNLAVYGPSGLAIVSPRAATLDEAAAFAREHRPVLAGSAAPTVAREAGAEFPMGSAAATADVGIYAVLGAGKAPGERPKPLYLREADAKPQAGFVLPRKQA